MATSVWLLPDPATASMTKCSAGAPSAATVTACVTASTARACSWVNSVVILYIQTKAMDLYYIHPGPDCPGSGGDGAAAALRHYAPLMCAAFLGALGLGLLLHSAHGLTRVGVDESELRDDLRRHATVGLAVGCTLLASVVAMYASHRCEAL